MLITGIGGGVAQFALLFAVAAGAKVLVTSSSDAKIQRAVSMGASGGVNYKQSKTSSCMSLVVMTELKGIVCVSE